MSTAITKSELIQQIASSYPHLPYRDIDEAIKLVIERLIKALESGERVEIRGFGSFSLHYRKPRIGRNPKTGEQVHLDAKYAAHFKPGKELREQVNDGVATAA